MPFINSHRRHGAAVAVGRQRIELAWTTEVTIAIGDFGAAYCPIDVSHEIPLWVSSPEDGGFVDFNVPDRTLPSNDCDIGLAKSRRIPSLASEMRSDDA